MFSCGYKFPIYYLHEVVYYVSTKDSLAWCGLQSSVTRVPYLPYYRYKGFAPCIYIVKYFLLISLVAIMLYIYWCTHSTAVFYREVLTDAQKHFIEKYFIEGNSVFLNSYKLSNMTLLGHGYLDSHVWFNTWIILIEDLSIYYFLPAETSSI